MNSFFKHLQDAGIMVFVVAAGISFIGSLPPGTTNVLAIQLAAKEGKLTAGFFALGCLLAESLYVALSLYVMIRLLRYERLIKSLQWISLVVLLGLALVSIMATVNDSASKVMEVISGHSPFVFGFMLMIINPVQVPFWLGWNAILLERKMLQLRWSHYIFYTVGAGAGSLLASIMFIWAGDWVFSFVTQQYFHYIIAIVFLITALLQLLVIIRNASNRRSVRSYDHSFLNAERR
ncbi:MAG: lysine transporter LysE [Chitinophagaceae bacterium]|nr:lysine transporter LysE [Chitinophagaceae bacterium]